MIYLGGGHPQENSIPSDSQELILTIPEELRGKELNITYGASWITNLKVNDSNSTVTGTVAANTGYTVRTSTITLTASGNLSTTSPYSFIVSQSGQSRKTIWFGVTLRSNGSQVILDVRADSNIGTDVTVKGAYYSSSSQYYNYTVVMKKGTSQILYYPTEISVGNLGGATISSLSPSSWNDEVYAV